MSHIDKMRQKQNRPPAEPTAQAEAMPTDEVVFECGHTRTVAALAKRKCPACIDEHHQKEQKSRKAEAQEKPHGFTTGVQLADRAMSKHGRLPNLSQYMATYNAETQEWLVTLAIDSIQEPFVKTGSSLIKTIVACDRLYREAVAKTEGK